MKVIPLDLNLEAIDALKKEASDVEKAGAKAKIDAFIADHTPPGGWPAKTTKTANDAANEQSYPQVKITSAMRRDVRSASTNLEKSQTDP